jgi:hypothetical protein
VIVKVVVIVIAGMMVARMELGNGTYIVAIFKERRVVDLAIVLKNVSCIEVVIKER